MKSTSNSKCLRLCCEECNKISKEDSLGSSGKIVKSGKKC